MRKLIGLMVGLLAVGTWLLAEPHEDRGAPIHAPKLITPVLEVVGHNNRIFVNGGYVLITNGNLHVDGTVYSDVEVIGTLSNTTLAVSGDATIGGNLTTTGKTTANGELEANDIVDINSSDTNDVITVDQTNTVGKSGVPYIRIKDARTGANANQTNEATMVISSEGTYAVAVTKGDVDVAGNVNAGGTITGAGRISSQSGSSGEIRLGYTSGYGWEFGTLSGGEILQFMWDYAGTGATSKASLTSNGLFTATQVNAGTLAFTTATGTTISASGISLTGAVSVASIGFTTATGGTITATGNISGANLSSTGNVSGSVVGFTTATGTTITADGTISGANVSSTGNVAGSVVGFTTATGTTVTATTLQGSLASTYIAGGICASMPVSATYSTVTNAQVSFQAKDPAGSNLARATGFEFWFSTSAVVTTPSTNNIESFSVANGDMRMYREIASAVPTYVAQTDANGLFRFNAVGITNDTGYLTNYVHLLAPNGYYTNHQMVWAP